MTITGGKWTSYRLMAEDTVDKAIEVCGLPKRKCVTKKFRIHGYRKNPDLTDHMYVYGSDEPKILRLIEQEPALGEKLSQKFGYTLAEVVWAVREEMAITLEDVLARRVRMLFVDARSPESRRGHGPRTGPRPGMDRRTGEKFHRSGEKLYL